MNFCTIFLIKISGKKMQTKQLLIPLAKEKDQSIWETLQAVGFTLSLSPWWRLLRHISFRNTQLAMGSWDVTCWNYFFLMINRLVFWVPSSNLSLYSRHLLVSLLLMRSLSFLDLFSTKNNYTTWRGIFIKIECLRRKITIVTRAMTGTIKG